MFYFNNCHISEESFLENEYPSKESALELHLYINKAFVDLENINFEPNQIILFYLAAYANILLEKNIDALNWINCGIDFATKNDSHYLLANLYYLLAKVLVKENKADLALNSNNRANIFKDLFNEQIFIFD